MLHDKLQFNRTPTQQVVGLLEYLLKRTDADYDNFCTALKEANQEHIVTSYLRG